MKKIAKILALVLVCVMLVGVLAACDKAPASSQGNASNSSGKPTGSGNNQGGNNQPQGDPYEVIIKYCFWWEQPTDEGTKGVEDAISEYVQSLGYNYTLKISWASLFEYDTQVDMALAAGEKMDIVFGNRDYVAKVNNGYLIDMTPYLDNELADAVEILGDWMICGKVNGGTYMMPCVRTGVMTYCYNYLTSYVDPVGYDMSKLEDFYDFEDFFAVLKAEYPDHRMDVDGSRYISIIADITHTSNVSNFASTVGDDTTIVNRFETDAWKTAIDYSYRFRTLGYTNPDGSEASAMNSEGPINGIQIGIIIGYGASPVSQAEMYTERTELPCGSVAVSTSNLTTITLGWGIAYTTENASAAATLLNLMWSDQFVYNAMMYGLEGRDYVFNADGYMEYPEGLDENTVPYQMMLNSGVFSGGKLSYPREAADPEQEAYSDRLVAEAWSIPLLGFTPAATDDLATSMAAVSNVIAQYYDTLCYGDLEPEATNATFLDALRTAGIDALIAEYDAQAQQWIADNK